ncbi:nuclear transport factor 2 family protein [Nocardioides albidus]|uniref:Nuclear transport factor 2 family protein n=1 Tax=Nocardioides albidus TaxID=1517589 RepID=A0A5C4W1C4_9ACTN|nr:nuclear transport factor 2 family protein [Nocardioides albidus]TNM41961.1 nuclear transport factor 2 family protein [Nocardioides albidus]
MSRAPSFAAEEITEAYAAFHEQVAGFTATGEWDGYADLFTLDAEYVEHAMGTFRGRDEIRAWAVRTMTSYPGRVMTGFPLSWQVVDPEHGRLVCEVLNSMPDPGDGTMLTEPNITIMTYAGDGLFSREEDVYNPLRFHAMAQRWARIAAQHDNADEDVLAWLDRFGGGR